MPIFGGIEKGILEFLLGASEMLSVPKDRYFFREKDRAEALYVLEAGEVAVLKLWSGHQNVLRHLLVKIVAFYLGSFIFIRSVFLGVDPSLLAIRGYANEFAMNFELAIDASNQMTAQRVWLAYWHNNSWLSVSRK